MAHVIRSIVTVAAMILFFAPEIFGADFAEAFSKPPFPKNLYAAARNVDQVIQRMRELCGVNKVRCDEAVILRAMMRRPDVSFQELYRAYTRYNKTFGPFKSSLGKLDDELRTARWNAHSLYNRWALDSSANQPTISSVFIEWYNKVSDEFLDVELQQEEKISIDKRLRQLFEEEMGKADTPIPPIDPQ